MYIGIGICVGMSILLGISINIMNIIITQILKK